MLTCFDGTTNFVFQKILNFFVKKDAKILDITYGEGHSWRNINSEHILTKMDKRKLKKDVIEADFNQYLPIQKDCSFDCIYFDPPYYFKEKIGNFNIQNQMFNNEEEVFWTEEELEKALRTLKKEVPRILINQGVIIIKIMDGYIGKKYYPNTFKIFNSLSNVLKPLGVFICPIKRKDTQGFIRCNHINYIVFKKER